MVRFCEIYFRRALDRWDLSQLQINRISMLFLADQHARAAPSSAEQFVIQTDTHAMSFLIVSYLLSSFYLLPNNSSIETANRWHMVQSWTKYNNKISIRVSKVQKLTHKNLEKHYTL